MALSHVSSEFLISFQTLEKTRNPIPKKRLDRWTDRQEDWKTDGWTDRNILFYSTLLTTTGGPIINNNNNISINASIHLRKVIDLK